jgi:hypothetical protein
MIGRVSLGFLAIAAFLFLSIGCGGGTLATPFNGQTWEHKDVTFKLEEKAVKVPNLSLVEIDSLGIDEGWVLAYQRAAATWNAVGVLTLRNVPDAQWFNTDVLAYGTKYRGGIYGTASPYSENGRLIRVTCEIPKVSLSQRDKDYVALHEVGHWIGLGHKRDRGSVMYPGRSLPLPSAIIPQSDMDDYRTLYVPPSNGAGRLQKDYSWQPGEACEYRIGPPDTAWTTMDSKR